MDDSQQPATRADLDRAVEQFDRRIDRVLERFDHAIEAFTSNLSEVRAELIERIDKVHETLNRRLDRVETNLNAVQMQLLGMSKSLTDAERLDSTMLGTQSAQQRAIDDLAARVTRIERRLSGQP